MSVHRFRQRTDLLPRWKEAREAPQVTLFPVEVDGSRYLSFSGVTGSARNLRAAGRGELRRKGRTEAFSAIEVEWRRARRPANQSAEP
jgi:hypothetical protein